MEPKLSFVEIDRDWWQKLPKEEQRRITELVDQENYVSREKVKRLQKSMAKGYTNFHH